MSASRRGGAEEAASKIIENKYDLVTGLSEAKGNSKKNVLSGVGPRACPSFGTKPDRLTTPLTVVPHIVPLTLFVLSHYSGRYYFMIE